MSKNDAQLNKALNATGEPPILKAAAERRKKAMERFDNESQKVQPPEIEVLEDEEYDEEYDDRGVDEDFQNDERDSRSHPSRPSRYSESRSIESSHPSRELEHFLDGVTLPYIEARPGFDQRWVRVNIALSKDADASNYSKKMYQRWTPRQMDTVPNYIHHDLNMGTSESLVRIAGHILMERPIEISKQFRDAKQQKTQDMTRAIHQSDPQAPKGNQYFGEIYVDRRKVVGERGKTRAVRAAD